MQVKDALTTNEIFKLENDILAFDSNSKGRVTPEYLAHRFKDKNSKLSIDDFKNYLLEIEPTGKE